MPNLVHSRYLVFALDKKKCKHFYAAFCSLRAKSLVKKLAYKSEIRFCYFMLHIIASDYATKSLDKQNIPLHTNLIIKVNITKSLSTCLLVVCNGRDLVMLTLIIKFVCNGMFCLSKLFMCHQNRQTVERIKAGSHRSCQRYRSVAVTLTLRCLYRNF